MIIIGLSPFAAMAQSAPADLRVTVTSEGQPVSQVTVIAYRADRQLASSMTSVEGVARLRLTTLDSIVLLVRKIGFTAAVRRVVLAQGGEVRISLSPVALALVRVNAPLSCADLKKRADAAQWTAIRAQLSLAPFRNWKHFPTTKVVSELPTAPALSDFAEDPGYPMELFRSSQWHKIVEQRIASEGYGWNLGDMRYDAAVGDVETPEFQNAFQDFLLSDQFARDHYVAVESTGDQAYAWQVAFCPRSEKRGGVTGTIALRHDGQLTARWNYFLPTSLKYREDSGGEFVSRVSLQAGGNVLEPLQSLYWRKSLLGGYVARFQRFP